MGLSMLGTSVTHARAVKTDHVEAELVAESLALVPGQSAWLALRLKHDPKWHTYWRNPGDSGLPTKIEWTLPSGFSAGPIEWPAPQRIPIPPLANYGYEGEVLLLVPMQVPAAMLPGNQTLRARADWLVCKDVCIPGGADLSLTLPVALGSPAIDDRWTKLFAATRAALPGQLVGWTVAAAAKGDAIELTLSGDTLPNTIKSALFFTTIEGLIEPGRAQTFTQGNGALKLRLPVAQQLTADGRRVEGVMVTDPPLAAGARAFEIRALMSGAIEAGKPDAKRVASPRVAPETLGGAGATDISLALALLFAFLGGVILNLMPCVFPVLSIKILGFADQAHGDRRLMRAHGLAYAAGVVVSFVGLAALLMSLRASGEALGWGFQLQSPPLVAALAVLFFAIALNLSGVFEILLPLPNALTTPARNPIVGAFGGGVLAAVVASPCTAPFMGAALGYALTQSGFTALLVFFALGAGMALPYVLLTWFPGWLKRLPRPGPWLERLKQLLAFPLYATVVWLVWVLAQQTGIDGVARIGAVLVITALGAWALGIAQRGAGMVYRLGAALALVAAIVIAGPLATATADLAVAAASDEWEAFEPARIDALVAAGKPVFVDFTAAWCVTCQVNKKLVLDTDTTRTAFAAKNVVLMRADWTRRDAVISTALSALGRNGVPVYVLYRPGKSPLILPELLQESVVKQALSSL